MTISVDLPLIFLLLPLSLTNITAYLPISLLDFEPLWISASYRLSYFLCLRTNFFLKMCYEMHKLFLQYVQYLSLSTYEILEEKISKDVARVFLFNNLFIILHISYIQSYDIIWHFLIIIFPKYLHIYSIWSYDFIWYDIS